MKQGGTRGEENGEGEEKGRKDGIGQSGRDLSLHRGSERRGKSGGE